MTGGVVIVPFGPRHRDVTLAWMNDPECMRLLNRDRVINGDEHARWFEGLHGRSTVKYFGVEDESGAHLGNVWLVDIDRRHRKAEVRILIGPADARGRGIGTRALDLVANEAFQALNLHRLYAYVFAFNLRARRAFERAGFAVEGTLRADRVSDGAFADAVVFGRLAEETASG